MKPRYHSVDEMVGMIEGRNGEGCRRLLADHRKLFQTAPGSTNNHQAWPGGYFDHVQEIMNYMIVLYEAMSSARPLPFSLSDALLVVYLHDIEKPWKYERRADGQLHHVSEVATKPLAHEFRLRRLKEYGIVLTPEQLNGLTYAEGELADYSPRRRVMGPLAALCHMADVASARIGFDHPLEKDDPWEGAGRVRDCLSGRIRAAPKKGRIPWMRPFCLSS